MILDYLIGSMKCSEDLLDFCDQLDKFNDSPDLLLIAQELRKGNVYSLIYVMVLNYFHIDIANKIQHGNLSGVPYIGRHYLDITFNCQ